MRPVFLLALFPLVGAFAPAEAHAASVQDLCVQSPPLGEASPALVSAARDAEQMIGSAADRAAAGDRAIATLTAAIGDTALSDDRTLAVFCNAAGEAYRLGNNGSPYQAQQVLLAAFGHAERAGDRADSATAAYRLGMVSASGTVAATGARGARRSAVRGEDVPDTPQLELNQAGSDACPWLRDSRLRAQTQAFITYVALQCAVDRAQAGMSPETAARAGLKLARFWGVIAVRQPADAAEARGESLKAALDALSSASRVADADLRATLTAGALEAALDAGGASEAAVRDGVRGLTAGAGDDPKREAQALALAARLKLADKDRAGAAGLLRRATFLESQSILPDRLADWHLLLAEADPANRTTHIAAAFRALNAVRPALAAYDPVTEESVFALRIRPVFEALVDTLLASTPGDDPVAIDQIQTVVEEYRQAELQSLFGSECVAARPPIKPAELGANEVLLYPILLPDRVELLYAAGGPNGQARYRRLPVNREADRSKVAALVLRMVTATSSGSPDWKAPARALYDILIKPVEGALGPESTLVVIPDGPLAALPFAALTDADGKFLIERTRLSTVPALAYSQPGGARKRPNLAVVAAALEKEVVLPAGNFPQLIGTGEEARFAYQIGGAGGDDALIENFRRADLVRVLSTRQADVLHLATHASFNGRSDRSYIVADGEAIPLSELRSLISTNQTRGDQLDLLILSACETAVGDEQASMGLAGAAVQAGATSALASLWQVNDQGTEELMKAFYTRYKAGQSKAEALRGAQVELIKRGGALGDPNIWAAFTLLGGWR
ncbi:CHAT domain-containing protein [Sphingomonas tabacisoli]|uniref:CHAT domain-containing protein n=1 Tax=Sphingomonas tabacisoli TaxID=2249466 RepID=A0ABW4I4B0_9SPHN